MADLPRQLLTFDPVIDLRGVTLNGRYIFSERFRRALLNHPDVDALWIVGDAEQNRMMAYAAGLGPFVDKRLQFADLNDLPALLKEETFLAVHTCMNQELLGPQAQVRRLCPGIRVPLTATLHVLYGTYIPHIAAMMRAGYNEADAVICPSPSTQVGLQALLDHLGGEQGFSLVTLPHGIDTEKFSPGDKLEARRSLGVSPDVPLVLFVGRLTPFSKLDFSPVLRALKPVLKGRDPRPVLMVVGTREDSYIHHVARQCEALGIELKTAFGKSEDELVPIYRAADVFLGLSDTMVEMFGLTVQEAMACGTPCVVSDVGGYRNLAKHEDNALVVSSWMSRPDPNLGELVPFREESESIAELNCSLALDQEGVARSVRSLLDSPELGRRLAQKARQDVLDTMTWPHVIDRHLALWRRLWTQAQALPAPVTAGVGFPFYEGLSSRFTTLLDDASRYASNASLVELDTEVLPFLPSTVRSMTSLPTVRLLVGMEGAFTLADLLVRYELEPAVAQRALAWSLRQGLLKVVD
jgi:glycosyltransferase involved in cell wall biosynthesis